MAPLSEDFNHKCDDAKTQNFTSFITLSETLEREFSGTSINHVRLPKTVLKNKVITLRDRSIIMIKVKVSHKDCYSREVTE